MVAHVQSYERRTQYRPSCSCGWVGEWTSSPLYVAAEAYERHIEEATDAHP